MLSSVSNGSGANLMQALWPPHHGESIPTWAILDCARDERIYSAIERSSRENCCLFAGSITPALRQVAPHLVRLAPHDRFTTYVLEHGWGNAWGILLRSHASLDGLRRHLRTFLRVRGPDGKHLLFRYYYPRVLRDYLPTCLPSEWNAIFGSVIDTFLVESEHNRELLKYRVDGPPPDRLGALVQR